VVATPVGEGEEQRLLAAARAGDEAAFERLLDPFRSQLAVGTYTYLEGEDAFLPFSLDVLTLEGEKIKAVDAFIVRGLEVPDGHDGYSRFPDFPPDPRLVLSVFTRCGLPDRLDTD
jgi:hypothetical protein